MWILGARRPGRLRVLGRGAGRGGDFEMAWIICVVGSGEG
jgi:hypothetical protein